MKAKCNATARRTLPGRYRGHSVQLLVSSELMR